MSADANKAAVKAAYDGFLADDLEPLMSILASDVEWTNYEDNPFAGTHHGPEGVEEAMAPLDLIDLTRFEVKSVMAEGGQVVAVLDVAYTVKATGKDWEGPAAHLFDFEDGKIKRFREVVATSGEVWKAPGI